MSRLGGAQWPFSIEGAFLPVKKGAIMNTAVGERGRPPRAGRQPTASSVSSLLDIHAVAEALCVTPRHIQRLVAERRIPYLKVGRFVRTQERDGFIARALEAFRRTDRRGFDHRAGTRWRPRSARTFAHARRTAASGGEERNDRNSI
jgi:hypothetical protein